VPSRGRSSWKPSNPSAFSTAPARAANRFSRTSPEPSGTVRTLMTTTLTVPILPHGPCRSPGVALDPTGSGTGDRSALGEVDRALGVEGPAGVVRNLPRVPFGIDEDPGVAAVEGGRRGL